MTHEIFNRLTDAGRELVGQQWAKCYGRQKKVQKGALPSRPYHPVGKTSQAICKMVQEPGWGWGGSVLERFSAGSPTAWV